MYGIVFFVVISIYGAALCVVGSGTRLTLHRGARQRLSEAFRPKTQQCYHMLFRTFVGFCLCLSLNISKITSDDALSYLEYLPTNNVSVNMIANHVSAVRANFVILGLSYHIWDHPSIKYFQKSIKINRPLAPTVRNIIDIHTLTDMVNHCESLYLGPIFKSVFLIAFFGFLRLSNISPHSVAAFDPSRHLTTSDVIFTSKFLKIIIKWSKTLQTRDKVQVISLPRLKGSPICPHRALKQALKIYKPLPASPLFQYKTVQGWQPLTDSKIRKVLTHVNSLLGLPPHFYTFHSFRRSAATLAYNANIPLQQIKHHGSWASDCVWTYIQKDQSLGEEIATSFATALQ